MGGMQLARYSLAGLLLLSAGCGVQNPWGKPKDFDGVWSSHGRLEVIRSHDRFTDQAECELKEFLMPRYVNLDSDTKEITLRTVWSPWAIREGFDQPTTFFLNSSLEYRFDDRPSISIPKLDGSNIRRRTFPYSQWKKHSRLRVRAFMKGDGTDVSDLDLRSFRAALSSLESCKRST